LYREEGAIEELVKAQHVPLRHAPPLKQSTLVLQTPPTSDWFEQAPETDSQAPHDSAAAASLQQ
jgi:hypothetical protein